MTEKKRKPNSGNRILKTRAIEAYADSRSELRTSEINSPFGGGKFMQKYLSIWIQNMDHEKPGFLPRDIEFNLILE